MDRELTKVVEDFDRAVGVEALRLANESSRHSFLNLSLVEPHSLVQSEQSESESNESWWSKSEQSKNCCLGALSLSILGITATSAVWTAPANRFSIRSWTGSPINRGKIMFSKGMDTGSTARPESEKPP